MSDLPRGRATSSRFNFPAIVLGLFAVFAVMLGVASVQAYFARWLPSRYDFWRELGFSSTTADQIMSVLGSLVPQSVMLFLGCIVALIFVGALRWQRAHAR
ncbi:hypothetical protein [Leifsonia sp. A12D58]|uniref:hypothetical protein n=1 Tax=Leifsonia sp. A12D58 TaxID=3397674 RepID=UPI0039E0FA6D